MFDIVKWSIGVGNRLLTSLGTEVKCSGATLSYSTRGDEMQYCQEIIEVNLALYH